MKPDPETVAKGRAKRKAQRQARKREGRVKRDNSNIVAVLGGMKPKKRIQ